MDFRGLTPMYDSNKHAVSAGDPSRVELPCRNIAVRVVIQFGVYALLNPVVEVLFRDVREGNVFTGLGVGASNIDSPLHVADYLVRQSRSVQFGDVPLNARRIAADRRYSLANRVHLLCATQPLV